MKALEKLHLYKADKGEFSAWIYRIARNTLFDYFRTRKKEVDIDSVWDLSSREDLELDAENRDQWERLQPYLQELKPEHRDIVMMRIWDEMSYKEIAEVLGKNEAACKMTFSRTISRLKEIMPAALFGLLLQIKDLVKG